MGSQITGGDATVYDSCMASAAADVNDGDVVRWASKVTPITAGDAIIIGVGTTSCSAGGGSTTASRKADLASLALLWSSHCQRLLYVHGNPVAIWASSMGTPYLYTYDLARYEYCNREQ